MTPTEGIVFVTKEVESLGDFEVVGKVGRCKVTACGEGVTRCKPGDYVIFADYREYDYQGDKIIAVNETDIAGVDHA